jgi:hypothetical protein
MDTFSLFNNESLQEMMFNAQHGISYRASRETLGEIEKAIVCGEGNPRLLGRILFLVSGLLGVSGSDIKPIMRLFRRVLEYMQDVKLDDLITGRKFTGGRAMSAAVFAEIVPGLTDETLFMLTRDCRSLIRVVDAYGIEIGNIPQHVYREQIKRYKPRDEMGMTVRELLNSMDSMEDKQNLLSLVFESKKITEGI